METSNKAEEEEYADSSSDSILSDEWQELSKSDYAKVIFCDLYHHSDSGDVGCMFQITDNVHEDPCDFVGLFRVGYDNLAQCLVPKMLSETECEEDGKLLRCVFKSKDLPDLEDGFYQFLYVTRDQEVCGASMPFEIKQARPKGDSSDDDVVAEKAEDDFLLVRYGLEKKNKMLEELLEKYRSKLQTLTSDMESLINSKDKACQEKEEVISNLNQEILHLKGQSTDMQSLIRQKESIIQNMKENQEERIAGLKEKNIQLTRELKRIKHALQVKEEALSLIEPQRHLLVEQVDDQKFMIRALEDSKSLALKEMSELSESLSKRTKVLNQTRCELATYKGKWKEASASINQQVERTNKLSQEVKDLIKVLGEKEDLITKQVIEIDRLVADKRRTEAVAQLQNDAKFRIEQEMDVLSETQKKIDELQPLLDKLLETTNFSCSEETRAFLGIKIQMIMLFSMMRKPGVSSINNICCPDMIHDKDTPEKKSVKVKKSRSIPAELQNKQNYLSLPQAADEEEKKLKRSLPQVIQVKGFMPEKSGISPKSGLSTVKRVCTCTRQQEMASQKVDCGRQTVKLIDASKQNRQGNENLLQKHQSALKPADTTPTSASIVQETAPALESDPESVPKIQPSKDTSSCSINVASTSQASGQTKSEQQKQDVLAVYTKCGHIFMEDIQNVTTDDIVMVNRLTDRIVKVDKFSKVSQSQKASSYSAVCDFDSGEDQDGELSQKFSVERDMFKLERITRIIKQYLGNVKNWSNVVHGCNLSYASLPSADQIDIIMDECKSRYQLEILLEHREKQNLEMKEFQDKICDLIAEQNILKDKLLDLEAQRSELRTRLSIQDNENVELNEECKKKCATLEAVNAEKAAILKKEAELLETVADHSARLAEAAELYKKMFLEIQKLKKKIKKSSKSSKVTSDVSCNSSENDSQLSNSQRLQPLRNTSDSDTGEHVLGNNAASPCPTTLQENVPLEGVVSQAAISSDAETKKTSSDTNCVTLSNENVASSTSATANSLLAMPSSTKENQPEPSHAPVVTDMQSMQRLLTEKLNSMSDSSPSMDKPKVEVFEIPCFLCNATFSISSLSTVILMDHFETEHQLQMCPICGQLFEPCIPKKYFHYHVEDHFKSE